MRLVVLAALWPLQSGLAQQSGCGTNPFQDWFYVSPTRPFVTIQGVIARGIKLNTGSWYDDGDWNIFVDPSDHSLLKNSSNQTNANGLIELEINSRGNPSGFSGKFPVGTAIEACGAWVEDSGHGAKTELHPLTWMRTVGTNPIRLYMATDDTGRFVNSSLVNYEWFEFPLETQERIVTPWHRPASLTVVLTETSAIARGTTRAYQGFGVYNLGVFLDSWWFSHCQSVGRSTYGDSPYYFGALQRSTAPLLSDAASYSVSTEVGTGQKIASVDISAQLADPPQGALAYSKWRYESSFGANAGGFTEVTITQPPHAIQFSMPYAPAIGCVQNSWRLSVVAGTVADGALLPSVSSDSAVAVSRTMAYESRLYSLGASTISLDALRKAGCAGPVYISLDESKLLPQVALRALRWFAKKVRDHDGFDVLNPVEVEVTTQTPLDDIGFVANTYVPPNAKRIDINWKPLASGLPNLTRLIVTARAVTELGEQVSESMVVTRSCGIGTYEYHQIVDYSWRLISQKGLGGELYESMTRASRADRQWIEVLGRFMDGRRLTVPEQNLLVSRAREGESLPGPRVKAVATPPAEGWQKPRPTPIVIPDQK